MSMLLALGIAPALATVLGPRIDTLIEPVGSARGRIAAVTGRDGPIVAYRKAESGQTTRLKLLLCNDPLCTGGDESVRQLDGRFAEIGPDVSMVLNGDEHPLIAYNNASEGSLRLFVCADRLCGPGGTGVALDAIAGRAMGGHSAIAIGADGFPVISHHDETLGQLRLVKCIDPVCADPGRSVSMVDSSAGYAVGLETSIIVPADNRPVISYRALRSSPFDAQLRVLRCGNPACTSGNTINIIATHLFLGIGRMVAGHDGLPRLVWSQRPPGGNFEFRHGRCTDLACTPAGVQQRLVYSDPKFPVGMEADIAIRLGGAATLAEITGAQFSQLHFCANADCSTFSRSPELLWLWPMNIALALLPDQRPVLAMSGGELVISGFQSGRVFANGFEPLAP
jgi:hypothetical protein